MVIAAIVVVVVVVRIVRVGMVVIVIVVGVAVLIMAVVVVVGLLQKYSGYYRLSNNNRSFGTTPGTDKKGVKISYCNFLLMSKC